jgi:hypothetical protein
MILGANHRLSTKYSKCRGPWWLGSICFLKIRNFFVWTRMEINFTRSL